MQQKPQIVLASTSKYRQALLLKLGLPFVSQKPLFDEDRAKLAPPAEVQTPEELCLWLGEQKAQSLLGPNTCVIGSDQMVVLEQNILGKPGDRAKAKLQLQSLQGKSHKLLTSVCVLTPTGIRRHLNTTHLRMRNLNSKQIDYYLDQDTPFDCAGSYKIELNGLALFEQIDCEDFSAIQGLPLLWTGNQLQDLGYTILGGSE